MKNLNIDNKIFIDLCVQTKFRYLVANYFLSIFKKAGFNMALTGVK
jgi:hypothetical protein